LLVSIERTRFHGALTTVVAAQAAIETVHSTSAVSPGYFFSVASVGVTLAAARVIAGAAAAVLMESKTLLTSLTGPAAAAVFNLVCMVTGAKEPTTAPDPGMTIP